MPNDGASFGGIASQAQSRNIGMLMRDHAFVAEMRQPPQALERQLDLADAPCERDAQGGLRPLAEDPVGLEPVADLKPFHAVDERALVYAVRSGQRHFRRQIAERDQLPTGRSSPAYGSPGRTRRQPAAAFPGGVGGERAVSRQHGPQGVVLRERGPEIRDGLGDSILGDRRAEQRRKVVAFGRHRAT